MTKIPILYEDDDLWVINKPAGMVVNQASTVKSGTIQDWAKDQLRSFETTKDSWTKLVPAEFDQAYGTPEDIFLERQGVAHRLDKDTSGALIIAKNPGALVALLSQFKQRRIEKQYQCLVHGKFAVLSDTIATAIARSKSDRQRFTTDPMGRKAETTYKVLKYFPHIKTESVTQLLQQQGKKVQGGFRKRAQIYQGFSIVNCWPKTGRTHQIRVHLASIKHPLVGDTKYIGRKRASLDPLWCPRQFLHAYSISFTQPRTDQRITVEVPLADDLANVISLLSE